MKKILLTSSLFLIFGLFLFSIPSKTYADCGSVAAMNARSGLAGSAFGEAAMQNCINANNIPPPSYSGYAPTYYDYNNYYSTELEMQRIEKERAQALTQLYVKFDKECKEKYMGPNSRFDKETTSCKCNIGYVFSGEICEDQKMISDRKFEEVYYYTLSIMPEYREVVDKAYIKLLASDPANAKFTLSQIFEQTYGNQIRKNTTITPVVEKPKITPQPKPVVQQVIKKAKEEVKLDEIATTTKAIEETPVENIKIQERMTVFKKIRALFKRFF